MKNLLSLINSNLKYIALAVIALFILLSLRQCSKADDLARENAILKQKAQITAGNVEVMKDSMEYWQDKQGNNLSEIKLLSADKDMLNSEYRELNAKFKDLVKDHSKDGDMIAYLNTKIEFKDREISGLKNSSADRGSRIINDSTILIDVTKQYDTLNYYKIAGSVFAKIRDNKIQTGNIDLTTTVGMGIELGIARDPKTKIANITTKTAFPAKIELNGITQIEHELNKKPSGYLGLSLFGGYGAVMQSPVMLSPMIGVGVYYSPRWLTIKLNNR
jgi:hypothetical protein